MSRLAIILLSLVLCSILFTPINADRAYDICVFDDETLTNHLHTKLHEIDRIYKKADEEAKKRIEYLESHNRIDDEFLKEYANFKNNYKVIMNVLALKPIFCERLIEELEETMQHFLDRAMAKAADTP